MNPRRFWWFGGYAFLLAVLLARAAGADGLTVSAPAFGKGKPIPARYAYKGKDISPELRLSGLPANAKSLVVIVDDPDSPSGVWTHWLVWNIPVAATIPEGNLPEGAVQGKNSFGHSRYDGPAPPSGTHRYFFRVYALDTMLTVPPESERAALMSVLVNGHLVGEGETFGTYTAAP